MSIILYLYNLLKNCLVNLGLSVLMMFFGLLVVLEFLVVVRKVFVNLIFLR